MKGDYIMKYQTPIFEMIVCEDVITTSNLNAVDAGDNLDNIDFTNFFKF